MKRKRRMLKEPKRLPRKFKKDFIKGWGRDTYIGLMKGYIYIAPYIIKYTDPIIIDGNSTNTNKPIITRYANKPINPKYYGKL